MTAGSFLFLFLTAVCIAIANLLLRGSLLKSGQKFSLSLGEVASLLRQPMFASAVVLVGVASVLWFRILSTDSLTVSYPLLVSFTYVLISLGAMQFFHERVSFQKVTGVGLILIGMLMLTRS